MSANLRKRLTLGMVLLCVIAWPLCLPWLTTKLVWIGGKHGYCPLRLLVHIALLFCAIAFAIPVVGIISLKSKGKSAIALGVIFWVLAAGWSIITIHRNTVSGKLMKEYCRGFSETIQSHIDVAGLNEFFSMVLRADEEDRLLYRLDPQSPLNRIVPGSRPIVTAYTECERTNVLVLVSWSCVGLVHSDALPPKRGWLDGSIQLTDRIWVVTRGGR